MMKYRAAKKMRFDAGMIGLNDGFEDTYAKAVPIGAPRGQPEIICYSRLELSNN